VFKRRNKQTYSQWIAEFLYPRKGWRRGIDYVSYRIKRLPDTPHKIALGIACGTFVTFTPLFGLHFFLAWFLALMLRGNVLAAILGTFVGNPITFPFIAASSYQLGLTILGMRKKETVWVKLRESFEEAFITIWSNFKSLFGYEKSSWDGFVEFLQNVFLPYLIGGIIPGIVTAVVMYFFSKPLIATYQKRRRLKLRERRARKALDSDKTE
jgi:uncharacterized protein (DUF2062 family)